MVKREREGRKGKAAGGGRVQRIKIFKKCKQMYIKAKGHETTYITTKLYKINKNLGVSQKK